MDANCYLRRKDALPLTKIDENFLHVRDVRIQQRRPSGYARHAVRSRRSAFGAWPCHCAGIVVSDAGSPSAMKKSIALYASYQGGDDLRRFNKLLVVTDQIDQTEQARHAQQRAALLSTQLGAAAFALGSEEGTISNRAVRAGAGLLAALREGGVARDIATHARDSSMDLIVVAARGKNLLTDLFIRQNNRELVRVSDKPLLLVNRAGVLPYRQVVIATDFSDAAEEAAHAALELVPEAEFTYLHAVRLQDEGMMRELGLPQRTIAGFRKRACDAARGRMNDVIAGLGPRQQVIRRVAEEGHPVPVIVSCARRMQADLIVVGKHRQSRIEELLLDSVVQRLLGESPCDLLVVPPTGDRSTARILHGALGANRTNSNHTRSILP